MSSIDSIAVVVFLGASKRIACPGLLNDFTWTFGTNEIMTADLIEERYADLEFDKDRYRQLLIKRCSNLTDARLNEFKL